MKLYDAVAGAMVLLAILIPSCKEEPKNREPRGEHCEVSAPMGHCLSTEDNSD